MFYMCRFDICSSFRRPLLVEGFSPQQDRNKVIIIIPVHSKVVLVAVQDSGSGHARVAVSSLRRLGARGRLLNGFRQSFALVGYAGRRKPRWVRQVQRPRRRGPSVISTRIPLSGGDYYLTLSLQKVHSPNLLKIHL